VTRRRKTGVKNGTHAAEATDGKTRHYKGQRAQVEK